MGVSESITNALIRVGRPMTLRRRNTSPPTDVSVYGVSKGYRPAELVGQIKQGDSEVTFSNAQIAAASWPGPPVAGDYMVIDGKERSVAAVEPKYLGPVVVVYVCQVRG